MRSTCAHRGGWAARTRGEIRCRDCGTVRFSEYAALRPPGLPCAPRAAARRVLVVGRWGGARLSGLPVGWG
ncbi:DUF6255 family natural product biosynthesis protein [Streptomyces rectiverticillatus]|uniref:DUF6255 family natural product biosynthesis protein n=1 Tax=Streptomyces rectiverticillatus TaxID=173860 RepID=UPI003CCC9CCF